MEKIRFVLLICLLILLDCNQDPGNLLNSEPVIFPPIPLAIGNSWDYQYGDSILCVRMTDKFLIDSLEYWQLRCQFQNVDNSSIFWYVLRWDASDSILFRYKGNKDNMEPRFGLDFRHDALNKILVWGTCQSKLTSRLYHYRDWNECWKYELLEYTGKEAHSLIKPGVGLVFDGMFGDLISYKLY